jgi:hypothetical protein
MNSSIAKRIAGTPEQSKALELHLLALRILAQKRAKAQQ